MRAATASSVANADAEGLGLGTRDMKKDQRNGGRGGREKGETNFHCVDHKRPSLLQASGLERMWVQTAHLASARDRTSHSAWRDLAL